MTHHERELPSPFAEHDNNYDRLCECERIIADQQRVIKSLLEATTLLMRFYNDQSKSL